MNTLNPKRVGATLSVTTSILYVACALLITIVPKQAAVVFYNNLIHTIDVSTIIGSAPSVGGFFLGLLSIAIIGWLIGATFAAIYNLLGKYLE